MPLRGCGACSLYAHGCPDSPWHSERRANLARGSGPPGGRDLGEAGPRAMSCFDSLEDFFRRRGEIADSIPPGVIRQEDWSPIPRSLGVGVGVRDLGFENMPVILRCMPSNIFASAIVFEFVSTRVE